MAVKIYALDFDNEEWADWLAKELDQPKFRADQICQWLWQKRTFDAEEMTNLSKTLRDSLSEMVDFDSPMLIREQRSKMDGTRKYLWRLRDGNSVESVLLKQDDRLTACISTQVGCPLQCTFCATGLSGYVRNLTSGEIAGQFLAMEKNLGREINNLVYMGMGEPFLNTEEVLKSVRMLNNPKMRNLGIRHITISTSGIIPGIESLADSGLGVRLAISLHAADDELRSALMPVNQTYPVAELRAAMQEYQKITGNRITVEYALFGGVNDSVDRARELVRYLKGIHVFINLIPFNAVDGRYEKPRSEDVMRFRMVLETAGFETEIRHEQGADIDAACGQLKRKNTSGEPCDLEQKKPADKEKGGIKGPVSGPSGSGSSRRRFLSADARPAKKTVSGIESRKTTGGFVEERTVRNSVGTGRPGKAGKRLQGSGQTKEKQENSWRQEERNTGQHKKSWISDKKNQGADREDIWKDSPVKKNNTSDKYHAKSKFAEKRHDGHAEVTVDSRGGRDVKYKPPIKGKFSKYEKAGNGKNSGNTEEHALGGKSFSTDKGKRHEAGGSPRSSRTQNKKVLKGRAKQPVQRKKTYKNTGK